LLLLKGIYLYRKRLILTHCLISVSMVGLDFACGNTKLQAMGTTTTVFDYCDYKWIVRSLKRQLENTRKPHTDKHERERESDKNEIKLKGKKKGLLNHGCRSPAELSWFTKTQTSQHQATGLVQFCEL